MACKRTHASRAALPHATDDFTRIHGIGPILGKRLHSAGIRTFAQLATFSPETVASLIPNLSEKQVVRQNWIQQARDLASNKATSRAGEKDSVISATRQHYKNFTFEFLLDKKNKIRRIQVVHVQNGDVDTWTKWDAERLIDFLARHTGVRLPYPTGVQAALKPNPLLKPSASIERTSDVIIEPVSIPSIGKSEENTDLTPSLQTPGSIFPIPAPADHPPSENISQYLPAPVLSTSTMNKIRLLDWKTYLSNTQQTLHNLPHDQSFDVKLTLDLANASLADTSQLDFTAALYVKKLGNGSRQVIGETHNTVPYARIVDLTICNATLPQGLYRLEALLTLVPTDSSLSTRDGIDTSFQCGLFQVY